MISMTRTRKWGGEQHYALEVDAEGAQYIADVMRDYQAYDAGAVAIAEEIERTLAQDRQTEEENSNG